MRATRHHAPLAPLPPLAAAGLALLAAAGCSQPHAADQPALNPHERLTAGDGQPLEALGGPATTNLPPIDTRSPDRPSLSTTTLSREGWAQRSFTVNPDQPHHQTSYRLNRDTRSLVKTSARQRGDYPTQTSALDLGSNDNQGDLALEALALPPMAAIEMGIIPAVALLNPPWQDQRSPQNASPRQPAAQRLADIVGPEGDAAIFEERTFTEVDLTKLPPDAFIFRDGRWQPIPEAINPPPVVPAPTAPVAPAAAPTTAAVAPPPAPAPAQSAWTSPDGQPPQPPQPPRPAAASVAPAAQTPSRPTTAADYASLPDDWWVFRDGRWMTVREARELLNARPATPPAAEPKP
jgi:hypothetical protein